MTPTRVTFKVEPGQEWIDAHGQEWTITATSAFNVVLERQVTMSVGYRELVRKLKLKDDPADLADERGAQEYGIAQDDRPRVDEAVELISACTNGGGHDWARGDGEQLWCARCGLGARLG